MQPYLESLFSIIRVHELPVDSVVELLKLEQVLVCRAECAHLVVLADITEKHHSGPFVACSDDCPPILYASEFAESSVVSAQQSAGPARAIASLPFPLPTYATDVLPKGSKPLSF